MTKSEFLAQENVPEFIKEIVASIPDDHHFTDLCDDCRLKFLKMAVEHLERKVAAEKEGLNNDGEETDV